jgi:hypothetical protein
MMMAIAVVVVGGEWLLVSGVGVSGGGWRIGIGDEWIERESPFKHCHH